MSSLKNKIQALAETFTSGIIAAIRAASVEELLGGGSSAPAKRAPAPARTGGLVPWPAKTGKRGRRSASDLQHVVGLIVAKLGEHKDGLRSEQLQKALGLSKKDVTRPLTQALAEKKITK